MARAPHPTCPNALVAAGFLTGELAAEASSYLRAAWARALGARDP